MSQKYEFVFLTEPDMDNERQEEIFNRLEERIETTGAEVSEKEEWGEKSLSFSMEKNNSAFFWIWHLASKDADFDISPVTTYLNRQDDVLRYLLLKKED